MSVAIEQQAAMTGEERLVQSRQQSMLLRLGKRRRGSTHDFRVAAGIAICTDYTPIFAMSFYLPHSVTREYVGIGQSQYVEP